MTSNIEPETVEYECQFCHSTASSPTGSTQERVKACDKCWDNARADKTLARLKPINDPEISKMLRDYVYDE